MSQGSSSAGHAADSAQDFQKTLMAAFSKQFGQQSQILNYIQGKMTGMISNPTGFTQAAMTAMGTQATEGVANEFAQAQTAAKELSAQQGGNGLPSGVAAQTTASNANAAAQTEAAAQNQIQLENAQQQQQNYWNAVGVLGGAASTLNPTAYATGANGAASATAAATNAFSESQQTGFGNTFANSFASGLGKTLSGGGMFSGPMSAASGAE